MYLQVAGPLPDIEPALATVPGVTRVAAAIDREGTAAEADAAGRDQVVSVQVESEKGRDVRRELAAVVVGRGWGLLELRPLRMSLEDVFLSLTTEDAAAAPAEPEREEAAHA
jgi:ABC-2 type transport system ATP-binding protein